MYRQILPDIKLKLQEAGHDPDDVKDAAKRLAGRSILKLAKTQLAYINKLAGGLTPREKAPAVVGGKGKGKKVRR